MTELIKTQSKFSLFGITEETLIIGNINNKKP